MFARVHRSYIVNLGQVASIEPLDAGEARLLVVATVVRVVGALDIGPQEPREANRATRSCELDVAPVASNPTQAHLE